MRFHDFPRPTPRERYEAVIGDLVGRLRRESSVVAVYQLGSVGTPGISDIDLLAVVEDGRPCSFALTSVEEPTARYLLTHAPFGVSRALFQDALRLGLYAGLRLLEGEDLARADAGEPDRAERWVRRQTALEFLAANYVARSVEARYRLAGVRSLLLSVHAIRFDLDLLGVEGGPLRKHVRRVSEWRQRWFREPPSHDELRIWFAGFLEALAAFLTAELCRDPLALPRGYRERYARHVRLQTTARPQVRHRGLVLPPGLRSLGRRFARLQHRLNRFEVGLPAVMAPEGSDQDARFEFFRRLRADQAVHYPGLLPLLNSFVSNVL